MNNEAPTGTGRRTFFKKLFAGLIGAFLGLVPLGAGLTALLEPLRRKSTGSTMVRIASLDALPADNVPRRFVVTASRVDAWNRINGTAVGTVFLRRTADNQLHALNAVCPHAGCLVDFAAASNRFLCPCHRSNFALDGTIADRASPSPRRLDELKVELRKENEIWVDFQNFQAGCAEKIPVT